jgi:hypothetical protein
MIEAVLPGESGYPYKMKRFGFSDDNLVLVETL